MNRRTHTTLSIVAALVAAGSIALAQAQRTTEQSTPATDQQPQLPPGWTMEDAMAAAAAATPGPMHKHLAKSIGEWRVESRMWVAPDAEPMTNEAFATYAPMMDGRFVKVEMTGSWVGMGEYNAFGIYGYDNVTEAFQAVWIDNYNTGMIRGVGELSSDGALTWTFTHSCPIRGEHATMREVERHIDKNTKTLEMYTTDPISGREFKMLHMTFTRKADGDTARSAR